jgi:hypothetical protein
MTMDPIVNINDLSAIDHIGGHTIRSHQFFLYMLLSLLVISLDDR